MRTVIARRSVTAQVVLVSAMLALVVASAGAQVNPVWDHYKVYLQNPPFAQLPPFPAVLTDQFGPSTHQVITFEWFATPVAKMVLDPPGPEFPVHDSLLHYAWWRISPQPFGAIVTAVNQFGDHMLSLHEPVFLLNPALKNAPAGIPPPLENHYKCYRCEGQPVDRQVRLTDQFDVWHTTVLQPRFFCNPTAKVAPGGQEHPIVDPQQHYVCYEFQPVDPGPFTARMRDQFLLEYDLDLYPGAMLCVPTYKTGAVDAVRDTWGRLKLLYR